MPWLLNAIRAARLRKSPPWRQADLAVRIGSTQTDVSAYERGEVVPTLAKAFDIANALGVPVEQLFYGLFEASCERDGERRSQAPL